VALAQTGLAIGSVSRFLAGILTTALWNVPPYNPKITVQRPQTDVPPGTSTPPRINLFLYELEIDAAMRNISLTPGSQPPLWMVLRYLLTAFDGMGESDTPESHDLLGMGMQVLLGVFDANPAIAGYTALADNPEPLKLTFDQATPDLLSRLMQGPDDKFRCSAAFQLRPVLIAQPLLPTGMQLIGINYQLGTTIGLAGVRNFVLPSLGPQLDGAQPTAIELGDTLTLLGGGLDASGLTVSFASAVLTPNMQHPQALSVVVDGLDPTTISAGHVPVSVSQILANGLAISSEMVGVSLLPTVSSMTILSITKVSAVNPNVYATIAFSGSLLGGAGDYVEFALVQNGLVKALLDARDPAFTPPPEQTQQQFAIPAASAVPQGLYHAVLRVNGQQAKQAFSLNMVAP
jgi:hypothetical protein